MNPTNHRPTRPPSDAPVRVEPTRPRLRSHPDPAIAAAIATLTAFGLLEGATSDERPLAA